MSHYTEERTTYGLYSKPYFLSKAFIYVRSENKHVRSLGDLAGKKVAVVKGDAIIQKLKEHLPEVSIVETESILTSINEVLNGDVDALVEAQVAVQHTMRSNAIVGLRGISQNAFSPSSMHLFSRIDEPLLQSILQKGLDTVSEEERLKLQKKWLKLDDATGIKKINLTLDEEQWLSKHPSIRVGDDFSLPPFSFRDEQGKFSGMAAGYLEVISKRLDVTMEPVWGLSWNQVMDKVKSGEVDILPAVVQTSEREAFLNFTKPIISFPIVIATRKDGQFVGKITDLNGLKVGVVDGYVTHDTLAKEYPDLLLVPFKNLEEGMIALENKQINAFIDNLGSMTFLIEKHKLTEVRIAAPTDYRFLPLAIGWLRRESDSNGGTISLRLPWI